MQSLSWYRNRLLAMSPQEVWWRLGSKVRDVVDRCASASWQPPLPLSAIANGDGQAFSACVGTLDGLAQENSSLVPPEVINRWREDLVGRAEAICQNRLTFFDLENYDLSPEIRWNFEYAAKKQTPVGFAPAIDYRDYSITGDAKLVWEPNRHQHLVVLARAYRLTGENRYAERTIEQINSWIRQCPVGQGMNWRSPLELAIRLINWVWAVELIRKPELLTPEFGSRLLPVVYRHLREISRKYSRYSSANNHLVGEAAGVFIGSCYFKTLKQAAQWKRESREILLQEIDRQIHRDGGHCELATGYHLYVLELFLLAGLMARKTGSDFPGEYWQKLEKMFEFVAAFLEGGELPMFGDCDDGYVLDLGEQRSSLPSRNQARSLLAVGAALFGRSYFKALSHGFGESVFWLMGEDGYQAFENIKDAARPESISSRALPQSGYYLLQHGRRGGDDRISVTFDCGELGFAPLAAHGHADALSFTLRAFGVDVLVDPGTYDYFTYPEWRDYFRSTAAHNTIVVDDQDQSQMLGSFLWGRRASARCLAWQPSADGGGTVTGEHDGYSRLSDPVLHRRTIALDGQNSVVTVHDELAGNDRHSAAVYLHFAEQCQVRRIGPDLYEVNCGPGQVVMELDPSLEISVFRGSNNPILGWVSHGYHRKQPGTTLVGRCRWTGSVRLATRIVVGNPPRKT